MLYAVILAGGSGTRLWPESRQTRAKQFLVFESNRSMIRSTFDRLTPLVPRTQIGVLTTEAMVRQVQVALPDIESSRILAEPAPRNTAPCIGLAAIHLLHEDPDATMIVLPSDHVIRPESLFCDTLRFAAELVDEDPRRLVTLGIKPTFPSTSYGYIQRNDPLESPVAERHHSLTTAYHVVRFHEKPAAEKAQSFLHTGQFAWNAGIFVWKARTIFDLLCNFEPEIGRELETIQRSLGTDRETSTIKDCFPRMKKISIDYAVMEKADSIVMLESTFSWDDVGTWCSLDRLYADQRDSDGNLAIGAKMLAVDSKNCVVRSCATQNDIARAPVAQEKKPEHLFALLGLEDLIVVQTEDATLIAKKDREESVRDLIELLKEKKWDEFL